jgi:hypothetical protein
LSPGIPELLLASYDSRSSLVVDSALKFNLTSIPQGAAITSATFSLAIAGTQNSIGLPALNVTGFGSNTGAVQSSDFHGGTPIGSIGSGALPKTSIAPDALNIPFQFDVTPFVQSLVNSKTAYAGFVLDDPNTSNVFVWGDSTDPGERPSLAISFSAQDAPSVPEPPGALLLLIGLVGLIVVRWHCARRALARRLERDASP